MSCSTATAQQLSELQHSDSTAAFRRSQNGAGHTRSASKSRAGGFASTLQPLRLQALRLPALKIDRPSKYRILTPCLETRPVAITEWELTTPSLERDELSQRLTFETLPSETTETMRQPVVSLSPCLFVSRPPAGKSVVSVVSLSLCLPPPCRQISCLSCLAVSLSPAPARRRLSYPTLSLVGTPAGAQGRGSSLAGGGSGFWHGGPAKLRRCLTVQGSIGPVKLRAGP